ncbi:MAG: bifunctional adenosylcobinamide kinase/adenosylcobinamide-phosphate guanylyltransferase [Lachnospiraceae bacterium]|nr:bifunctional adenosylcobinamide kinase/adenosylcobinamide-phosphate guanylyltransferase [Lachnospiraceae bacterium]
MMTLIIGGSGSGKSAYAEEYITRRAGNRQKYYLATMQVYGEEGRKKVERHRQLRSGKGFMTIEQPVDIEKAQTMMQDGEKAALLECMSNLVANEMFSRESPLHEEPVVEKIVQGVGELKESLAELVIVTNNVFEDGVQYEDTTMEYIRAMGTLNERLAAMADEVIEVVVGIPLCVKVRNGG